MATGDVVKGIWEFFTPPDPPVSELFDLVKTPRAEEHMRAMRWWRVKVSASLAAVVLITVWSFTPWGFVLASDLDGKLTVAVQQTVASVAKEQQSVKQDVASIKQQNDQMAVALKELLRAQTANTICRLLNTKVSTDSARAQRRADADNEQEKYKFTTGDYYPESRCGSGQ